MLAIIIPYFKKTFFEETLKSLSMQTDKRFKVYIGDDASPENPINLLQSYDGKLNFEYYRFENNIGGISLVQQWRRCISLIKSEEWITILGDDDLYSSNFVEEFYNNLNLIGEENSSVIRFSTQIINASSEKTSRIFQHPQTESEINFLNRKFSKKTRSSLSEYVFKKSIVERFGFIEFPLAWHSDDLAVIQFSNRNSIFSINNSTVFVRVSNESITGSANCKKTIKLKSLATQDFLLNYILDYKGLEKETISKLSRKVEGAYFDSGSNRYLYKIAVKYLKLFNLYPLIRFTFLLIKFKLNARD